MSELDVSLMSPPQRRVFHELLAVGARRPPHDPELANEVREFLHERTGEVGGYRPNGARGLRLNKTSLAALDCEGRYLDLLDSAFAWSPQTVLGTLVHRAVELDQAGRRTRDVPAVITQAWGDFAQKGESAGEYLATLPGVEADALRAEAGARLIEFRECFPLVPPTWTVRLEPRLTVHLHRGAVELLGKPDLLFGGAHHAERRMLLIDLKTGRRSSKDREDMRFYALLATLKYGDAPFRVATYYLDEAAWDAEEIDAEALEAAARSVADRANRAARLTWQRPEDSALRLLAGPSCRWCGRAPTCPAKSQADADWALSAPDRG